MKPYEYSRLGKDQIRLLRLLPGPASTEVCIEIETTTLSKAHVPQYETLSYAWGSNQDPSEVNVVVVSTYKRLISKIHRTSLEGIADSVPSKRISITKNLAEALPYLRGATKPRTLWIDAICIDQKNGKEKGEQVSRMAEIYKSSSQVLVWLGPEMSASSAVIEFLNELSCQLSVDWATRTVSSRPGAVKDWREMIKSFYNSEKLVDGSFQLLTRPWFERLWVWQEIRAKDEALVMCSYDRILWQDLRSATYALLNSGQRGSLFGLLLSFGNMAHRGIGTRLESCTYLTRRCICADPRDRIFALKSLLDRSESDAIKPDYEKSTSEVYRDVMVEYALNLGRLDLLRLCNLSTKLEESPSWVPNWSRPQENTGMDKNDHGSGRSICEANVGMEIMEVAGTYCATVTQVEYLFDADASNMEVISKISEILFLHDMHASYVGGGNMLSAYCRTLFDNRSSEVYLPPRSDFYTFEYSSGILQDIITQNRDHELQLTSGVSQYLTSMRETLPGRTFIMTREGYMGTSVVEPQLGDQVVVLLGCDTPLLLRAAQGSHQVVGACYIQGLMYAEALLGPMSEGWEYVMRSDQISGGYLHTFVHKPSGRVQCEDPRLGPLPEGWSVKSHEEEDAFPIYVNDRTGEFCGKAYTADPRMTSEELRLRGVDMRTFRLV